MFSYIFDDIENFLYYTKRARNKFRKKKKRIDDLKNAINLANGLGYDAVQWGLDDLAYNLFEKDLLYEELDLLLPGIMSEMGFEDDRVQEIFRDRLAEKMLKKASPGMFRTLESRLDALAVASPFTQDRAIPYASQILTDLKDELPHIFYGDTPRALRLLEQGYVVSNYMHIDFDPDYSRIVDARVQRLTENFHNNHLLDDLPNLFQEIEEIYDMAQEQRVQLDPEPLYRTSIDSALLTLAFTSINPRSAMYVEQTLEDISRAVSEHDLQMTDQHRIFIEAIGRSANTALNMFHTYNDHYTLGNIIGQTRLLM